MSDWYLLDENHNPFPIPLSRVRELTNAMRRVALDIVGDLQISTVFLGLDHAFGGSTPILFETMIFGPEKYEEDYQERYPTWEDAIEGHAKAVKVAQEWMEKKP